MKGRLSCFLSFVLILIGLMLTGCGGGVGPDELADAISEGRTQDVSAMIKDGCDVNQYSESHGGDLLTVAVESENVEMVDLLLKAGAMADGTGQSDRKPLIVAVRELNTEIVKRLVSADADLEIRNDYKETSLMIAAEKGEVEMAALLMKLGSNPNASDELGNNALMNAIGKSQVAVLPVLIGRPVIPAALWEGPLSAQRVGPPLAPSSATNHVASGVAPRLGLSLVERRAPTGITRPTNASTTTVWQVVIADQKST